MALVLCTAVVWCGCCLLLLFDDVGVVCWCVVVSVGVRWHCCSLVLLLGCCLLCVWAASVVVLCCLWLLVVVC